LGDPTEKVSDEDHQESLTSQEEALQLPIEDGDFHRRAHEQLHRTSFKPS